MHLSIVSILMQMYLLSWCWLEHTIVLLICSGIIPYLAVCMKNPFTTFLCGWRSWCSNLLQVGDVAVLDISATTIDQDESNIQKIPSAESKGLAIFSLFLVLTHYGKFVPYSVFCLQVFILIQKMVIKFFLVSLMD